MVRDEDHGPLLDCNGDPLRRRLCPLLPVLHRIRPLSKNLDPWAEWLVRTRYEGRSEEEVQEMISFLEGVRERVLERARIASGDAVVDVGTGTGLLALGALERVGDEGEVFAVDVSVDCLEEAERTCRDSRVWYLVGSAEVLPLPDESVDVVMTRSVLIYVRRKAEAVGEFFRVLRQGGRVSIFEPINRDATPLWEILDFGPLRDRVVEDYRREWPADDPMLDFDERDLIGVFEAAGFRHIDADLDPQEQTLPVESLVHGVSAPGRRSLVERWRRSFSAQEVEELTAAVRRHGNAIAVTIPALYLSAMKE